MTHTVVDDLRTRAGEVVAAGDHDYDDARRVWNGMVDRRPLAVVRARDAAEVAATVAAAAAHRVPLAVRGGGHGVAGNGTVDDGVVLDLRALSSVEVDPDARTVRASDDPELLWGLRGGGGNFGVVTSLTLRAHPVGPDVLGGNLVYGTDRWREALAAWDRWTLDLPDAMQSILTVIAPPADWELGTDPVLVIGQVWSGDDPAEGERLADALRSAAPPDAEEVGLTPWPQWQSAMDELFPRGSRAYWRNTSFDRLDDDVVDVLVRRGTEQTWSGTAFDVHHMGGAFARVPEGATAFPARDARFWLNVYGFWSDAADDDARVGFVCGFGDEMGRLGGRGRYLNFMGAEPGDRRAAALAVWGEPTLARLTALKRRYDPENLFRLNHNVPLDA